MRNDPYAPRKIRGAAAHRNGEEQRMIDFTRTRTCKFCNEPFQTKWARKATCSIACAERYNKMQQREREQARRAKKGPRAYLASSMSKPNLRAASRRRWHQMVLEGPRLWLANIHPET
jgi:hypothetical protein